MFLINESIDNVLFYLIAEDGPPKKNTNTLICFAGSVSKRPAHKVRHIRAVAGLGDVSVLPSSSPDYAVW